MLVGVQPQGQGTIRVVGAKLHGIVVTESKLNYHGSITIDTDILEAARLLPLEYVYIWNKHPVLHVLEWLANQVDGEDRRQRFRRRANETRGDVRIVQC